MHADRVQLARAVSNLLVNGQKHSLPGTEIALLLVRQGGVLPASSWRTYATPFPEILFCPQHYGRSSKAFVSRCAAL